MPLQSSSPRRASNSAHPSLPNPQAAASSQSPYPYNPNSQQPPPSVSPAGSPFDLSNYLAFPSSAGTLGGVSDEVYNQFAKGIRETNRSNNQQTQQLQARRSVQQGQGSNQFDNNNNNNLTNPPSSSSSYPAQPKSNSSSGSTPVQDRAAAERQYAAMQANAVAGSSSRMNVDTSAMDSVDNQGSGMSPYGLDPSAFQAEVRFQLPSFLNPTSSTSAYPEGAEAWSGYGMKASMGNMIPGSSSGFGQNKGEGMSGGYVQQSSSQSMGMKGQGDGMADGRQPGQWNNWTFNSNSDGSKDYPSQSTYPSYQGQTQHIPQKNPAVTQGSSNSNPRAQQENVGQPQNSQMSRQNPLMVDTSNANSSGQGSSGFDSMPTSALQQSSSNWPPATGRTGVAPQPSAFASSSNDNENAFPSSSSMSSLAIPASSILSQQNNLTGLVQPGTLAVSNAVSTGGGNMPGLYSSTGFDMIGILSRVAARPDPKTVLGPVDFSCSFLVVDIRKFDSPIVYVSPTFTTLTGYDQNELLGKNCRLLQSPDGEVVRGSRRKYTDNVAVAHLKRMLLAGKECQASLINYRKGGQPFINLVTVVPIPWDGDEIAFHVGFQVDLVEQPNAILRNMRDGSYQVNYTVINNPHPPLPPAGKALVDPISTAAGVNTELMRLLSLKATTAISSGANGEETGKTEWLKCVLENTDDFVHVLSLKGQFQYVSPSVKHVLEYDADDLLNKHISDICHPSDIVPVMRELKDSTHSPTDGMPARQVNLLFRVRRKNSGYIWLECVGRLHVEPGKGRKAIILSGRELTNPSMGWEVVARQGGLSDSEFWLRLSFDGMMLWASSGVSEILGSQVDDVVGHSIYSLLLNGKQGPPSSTPQEESSQSAIAIEKALKRASQGVPKKGATTVKHALMGADGRAVDVVSIFYALPGGAESSQYPEVETPDSVDSDDSTRYNLAAPGGCRPCQIVVQVKLSGQPSLNRPLTHDLAENVFEELDTTRGTSWQYELHQLRIANRRLKDEIAAVRSGRSGQYGPGFEDDSKSKGKKRKVGGENMEMGPPPLPLGIPPNPEHPAPLHQQTPGFGLHPMTAYNWQ